MLLDAVTPPETDKMIHQLSMMIGFEVLEHCTQIVIAGVGKGADSLYRAAIDRAPPARLIIRLADDVILPDKHLAAGKGTTIHLETEGDQEKEAMDALVELINNFFDEGE